MHICVYDVRSMLILDTFYYLFIVALCDIKFGLPLVVIVC